MESDEQEDVLSSLPLPWLRRVNFKDCTDDIVGWQGAVPFPALLLRSVCLV